MLSLVTVTDFVRPISEPGEVVRDHLSPDSPPEYETADAIDSLLGLGRTIDAIRI